MRATAVVAALALAVAPASALETDQYWAARVPLRDSADAIDAKVNYEMQAALDEVNASRGGRSSSCEEVADRIARRFRFPFFQKIETWAIASPLVDRVPRGRDEEELYRNGSLYGKTRKTDVVRWMPLSPTIEAGGIRFGTDKLSHFFSQGSLYHRKHRRLSRRGVPEAAAERRAIMLGTVPERTVLGMTSSGVLSRADLEANYQGMRFYVGLCRPLDPAIERDSSGWRMVRPFALRDYVNPDWDESWVTPIFAKRRWRKVAAGLQQYCPLLGDPVFLARREAYAARDRQSVADSVVNELVRAGKLPDPAGFSLERACGHGAARAPAEGR